MGKTINVMPNQSLLDVALMAGGTLECAMAFCNANNTSISSLPAVGTTYTLDATAIAANSDVATLRWLAENSIVIGTRDVLFEAPPPPPPGPDKSMLVVLKPVMQAVPATPTPPTVLGYYSFDYTSAAGFINVYDLSEAYPYANQMEYVTGERHIGGFPPEVATEYAVTAMPLRNIPFRLNWVAARGLMLAWSYNLPGTSTIHPTTFKDVVGNEAIFAPLIVLDTVDQLVRQFLVANMTAELVSATEATAVVRITRSHASISDLTFAHREMIWFGDISGGSSDPADPTNPDKLLLILPAGSHTVGVSTMYINDVLHHNYPRSACSMVIKIS